QATKRPAYPASARMIRSRAKSYDAWASSHFAPSRSCTSAPWTTTASTSPSVSTSRCRLRPLTFFSRVEPAFSAAVGRLHALAVEHCDSRLFVSPRLPSNLLPQPGIHPFPGPVGSPGAEIKPDRSPGWEVARQHPPGTTGAGDVEYGVEHAPHVRRSRPAARPWL